MDRSSSTRSRAVRLVGSSASWLLVVGALVHPLAVVLARWSRRADLLTHFQEPALGVTLLAVVAMVWRRRRLPALVLAALAVWQVVPLVRYHGANPVPPDPHASERLRVVVANVLFSNSRHDLLADWIRSEQPDIVGLVEVTEDWLEGLADVRAQFPYRIEVPDRRPRGAQGLALWFREPPRATHPSHAVIPGGWPVLHATITLAGRPCDVWLVHPASPLQRGADGPSPGEELAALADRVRRTAGTTLVIGDLNSTEGSPHFHKFLKRSGLRDSRLGFGRQPSWPTWLPYRIAIDHAFVSPDLAVTDRRLGPAIGSDHLPFFVEVAPAAVASATNDATQAAH